MQSSASVNLYESSIATGCPDVLHARPEIQRGAKGASICMSLGERSETRRRVTRLGAESDAIAPVTEPMSLSGPRFGVTVLSDSVVRAGQHDHERLKGDAGLKVAPLVGMRTPGGTEFGVGPNVSSPGVGLVVAPAMRMRAGALNIPFNVAMVPSTSGTRVSVLTGFNRRKQ